VAGGWQLWLHTGCNQLAGWQTILCNRQEVPAAPASPTAHTSFAGAASILWQLHTHACWRMLLLLLLLLLLTTVAWAASSQVLGAWQGPCPCDRAPLRGRRGMGLGGGGRWSSSVVPARPEVVA
jgi:hypothetical protein